MLNDDDVHREEGRLIVDDDDGFYCRCLCGQEALSLHVRLHAGDRTCVTDLCALTAALQPGLVAAAQHHAAQHSTYPLNILPFMHRFCCILRVLPVNLLLYIS